MIRTFRLALTGTLLSLITIISCDGAAPPTDDDNQGGSGGLGATGGASSSGGSTDTGGSGGGTVKPTGPPEHLSETGLYDADMVTLSTGVRAYSPRFALWSDRAEKARWILLPEGEKIDTTTDPDFWRMPAGTKLWKEFTRDGTRVETRFLHKQTDGTWLRVAYQWNEAQTEATAVPDGVENASGTPHDIPSAEDCNTCHGNTQGTILGFSAVQLAHEDSDFNLDDLTTEGLLSSPVTVPEVPGTPEQQQVLGWFHANCGTCHNETSSVQVRVDMDLRLGLAAMETGDIENTSVYQTAVGVGISLTPESGEGAPEGADLRIDPGHSDSSAVFLRLNSRGESYSMPPLGTEDVDEAHRNLIETWIDSLPPL